MAEPYVDLLPGEQRLVRALSKVLDPKVLVDVGSNKGEYTRLLKDTYPEAKVYSFDPIYTGIAVGREKGTLPFSVYANDVFSTGAERWAKCITTAPTETLYVPVEPLSTLVEEPIDFLKIDTEGMEMDVLEGLGGHQPKVIQFEYGLANYSQGHPLGIFGAWFWQRDYVLWMVDWYHTYGNFVAAPPDVVRTLVRCITLES